MLDRGGTVFDWRMMAAAGRKKEDYRKAMLAKIHVAKKYLCLDDVDYRDIVESVAPGKRSSGDLDNRQLAKLLKHFESVGFKSRGQKSEIGNQVKALKTKAQRMLDEAVDMGFVRHPRKLVFKICNVDDIRFCTDPVKLKQLLAVLQRVE